MTGANRLNKTIGLAMHSEFVRGEFDCTQFAIDCEIAQTGDTKFPEFHRTYKSKKAGFAILLRLGFDNIWDCANSRLDEVELPQVKRGDLIGHLSPDRAIGIAANKESFWSVVERDGLVLKPMSDAHIAWSF